MSKGGVLHILGLRVAPLVSTLARCLQTEQGFARDRINLFGASQASPESELAGRHGRFLSVCNAGITNKVLQLLQPSTFSCLGSGLCSLDTQTPDTVS